MDPTSREDLSALMDGELAAEPTRFLLRRLEHDPELGATWSRWHLVRACLAADPARMSAPRGGDAFATRIAAALAVEPAAPAQRLRWARYAGGGAIAASVAVAALLLNAVNPEVAGTPAPVAQSSPAPGPALAAVADTAPAMAPRAPTWQLNRQPTVFGAQPASATVVYGTGLMQPEYLRRAAYADGTLVPYRSVSRVRPSGLPFTIVQIPEAPPASAAGGR